MTIGWKTVSACPQSGRKVIGWRSLPISGGLSDSNLARSACRRLVAIESLPWPDVDVRLAAPAFLAPSLGFRAAPPSAGRMAHKQIYYSDKYFDEHYEYR